MAEEKPNPIAEIYKKLAEEIEEVDKLDLIGILKQNRKKGITIDKMKQVLLAALAEPELIRFDLPDDEPKRDDILTKKIMKQMVDSEVKDSKRFTKENLEKEMDYFKVILKFLIRELEDPENIHEDLLDSYLLLFDEFQNFFRNHVVAGSSEDQSSPEKDGKDEKNKEERKSEDPSDFPEVTEEDLFLDHKDGSAHTEEGVQRDQEMAQEPERTGDSGATSNQVEVDDDGNNADTEGWEKEDPYEDHSSYFNEKNYDNTNTLYDTSFTPDPKYDYAFNEEMHCMVYTGPDFKVGDYVDAMKIEPETQNIIQCWEQAQIIHEDMQSYTIKFNRENDKYNRTINKDIYRTVLFKIETHTRNNYWRYQSSDKLLNLRVDYYNDMYSIWCKAKIMTCLTDFHDTIDQVVLDVYQVPDHYKSSFFESSDNKFPQLSIRSPCIKLMKDAHLHTDEEMELQEMNQSGAQPYGPQLPPGPVGPCSYLDKSKNKVSIQVKITEYFYEMGGHKLILKLINDTEKPLRAPIFIKLLKICMCVGEHAKKVEDEEFGKEFEDAFRKYIEEGLDKSIKEIKYDFFDTINTRLKKILLYPEPTLKKMIIFQVLDIAHKCLNCDYLSVRVNGCKCIAIHSERVFTGRLSEIKRDELGEWLSNKEVINSIFGSNHHSELFNRTEYILKVISRSKTGLKEEEMVTIWNLTKRDKQTKKEIYGILRKVGESLGKEFIEFILERIKEFDHLSNIDLEFMYSFKNKTELQNECTWKILNDASNYSEKIVKTAFEKIVDNAKFAPMEKKLITINDCIDKLRQHHSSLIFIKILKALTNCTNISTARVQNLTEGFDKARDDCLEAFYEDFEYYCDIVKKEIEDDHMKQFRAGEEYFIDQFNHVEHITERLEFIVDFYKLFKITLEPERVETLWRLLSSEAPCRVNYEVFFKWMNDQVNRIDTRQYCVLTQDTIEKFYTDYLIAEDNKYSHLESEGFSLIKTLFKIVNEKDHKLQILNSSQAKKEHGTISSACGSTLTSATYSSSSSQKEFVVYVHPDELKGIEILWRIVVECTDKDVIAKCIMFIDDLFHNISEIIQDQRMQIEEDLVKKCIMKIEDLKKICNAPDPEPSSVGEHMIQLVKYRREYAMEQIHRFFLHIRSFMENSELHGVGDFMLAHRLFNNTKITIKVNNNITWGPGCYNNKSNPKMFVIKTTQGMNIWAIKSYLASKLNLDPILLKMEKIYLSSREIKDCDNAKTLHELDVKNGDKFKITSKMVSTTLDQMNLLFSDNSLTPESQRMFTEVFNNFVNEEGFMTPETCTKFLQYCCNQKTDVNDSRIIHLFDTYCQTEEKLITRDDFLRFYKDSIVRKATIVWGNVRAWGYKQDLKKGTDRTQRDPNTLLRYLLPRNKEYLSYFVGLMKEKYPIAKDSLDLVSRLAVDPELYQKVSSLTNRDKNGQEKDFKFEELADVNNPFELMYLLSLIDYFIRGGPNMTNEVHVVYNESQFEAEMDNENFESMEVKGTSVSTGTA